MNIYMVITTLIVAVTSLLYFCGEDWINNWYKYQERMIDKKIQLEQLKIQAANRQQQALAALKTVEQGGQQ